MGEVENNSFIAGQAKGPQQECVCVSLPRLPGGVERSLAEFREQGMIPERVDSCWIGWHTLASDNFRCGFFFFLIYFRNEMTNSSQVAARELKVQPICTLASNGKKKKLQLTISVALQHVGS